MSDIVGTFILTGIAALLWLMALLRLDEPDSLEPQLFDKAVARVLAFIISPFLWIWEKIHDRRV